MEHCVRDGRIHTSDPEFPNALDPQFVDRRVAFGKHYNIDLPYVCIYGHQIFGQIVINICRAFHVDFGRFMERRRYAPNDPADQLRARGNGIHDRSSGVNA